MIQGLEITRLLHKFEYTLVDPGEETNMYNHCKKTNCFKKMHEKRFSKSEGRTCNGWQIIYERCRNTLYIR